MRFKLESEKFPAKYEKSYEQKITDLENLITNYEFTIKKLKDNIPKIKLFIKENTPTSNSLLEQCQTLTH